MVKLAPPLHACLVISQFPSGVSVHDTFHFLTLLILDYFLNIFTLASFNHSLSLPPSGCIHWWMCRMLLLIWLDAHMADCRYRDILPNDLFSKIISDICFESNLPKWSFYLLTVLSKSIFQNLTNNYLSNDLFTEINFSKFILLPVIFHRKQFFFKYPWIYLEWH